MRDILDCVFREFFRRKGRVLGNLLGYVLAIGLMVFLINLLIFTQKAEDRVLRQTGGTFLAFVPVTADDLVDDMHDMPFPKDKGNEGFIANTILTRVISLEKVKEIKLIPHVSEVYPFLLYRLKSEIDGHFFTVGGFGKVKEGIRGENSFLADSCCPGGIFQPIQVGLASSTKVSEEMLSGRSVQKLGEVVLEESYALNRNIKAGESVTLSGNSFPVVGIIRPGIRPAKADVYMTWEDAEKVINPHLNKPLKDQMNLMIVEVDDTDFQTAVIAESKSVLSGSVVSSYKCSGVGGKVLGINDKAIWLLIVIMGIGTILLSLKSQLTSVIERKKDIGILKALGWTNREIVGQVFMESILQGSFGGVLGCVMGALVFKLVPIKAVVGISVDILPELFPQVFLLGFIVALMGGGIAGLFPAYVAAQQSPAEAMRRI